MCWSALLPPNKSKCMAATKGHQKITSKGKVAQNLSNVQRPCQSVAGS